jgi:hypothetical protein
MVYLYGSGNYEVLETKAHLNHTIPEIQSLCCFA